MPALFELACVRCGKLGVDAVSVALDGADLGGEFLAWPVGVVDEFEVLVFEVVEAFAFLA
ncbi:MAG: hypothetical protein ACRDT6_12230 [Micromonosporaceae bacterium]